MTRECSWCEKPLGPKFRVSYDQRSTYCDWHCETAADLMLVRIATRASVDAQREER